MPRSLHLFVTLPGFGRRRKRPSCSGVCLRGCERPSLDGPTLLDWRHCGVDLVVILHHEIDIGREFHGLRGRFQF
jgi:hypothetical protein